MTPGPPVTLILEMYNVFLFITIAIQAALEAMNELDLFGSRGGPGSVINVQADQIQYCKVRGAVNGFEI